MSSDITLTHLAFTCSTHKKPFVRFSFITPPSTMSSSSNKSSDMSSMFPGSRQATITNANTGALIGSIYPSETPTTHTNGYAFDVKISVDDSSSIIVGAKKTADITYTNGALSKA